MARKKRGKRITRKKPLVKSKVVSSSKKKVRFSGLKIRLVVKNLIALVILTAISYILYLISEKEFYVTFFGFASAVLGFLSIALFLVLLVLLLLKLMRK